jgi:DNA polymerase-4
MTTTRAILHCDLDAFYASVEQLDHPDWRGKPVIVGGRPNERGVVAAASYEARAFGVRSAMPLREAGRLCPHAIFVPGDHERYGELSDRVMALFDEYTPLVEPISLDEAFLDVTESLALFGDAESIGRALKARVRADLGLVLSVGVAANKLCAKVASDLGKPDGFIVVPAGGEAAFLAPLEMRRLWGVGERTRETLAAWGLRTIGDIARLDVARLESHLGAFGRALWERAQGLDPDRVVAREAAKSVGHERTFDVDESDDARVEATLLLLTESVASRLRAASSRGRTVTVKLRLTPFDTLTRQRSFDDATDDARRIFSTARELYRMVRETDRRSVRLIGVSVSSLEHADLARQLALFDDQRRERLNAAIDAVRSRHGDDAIEPASSQDADRRRRFSDRRH